LDRVDAKKNEEFKDASHISLRDGFEITQIDLNFLVQLARYQTGNFGSRMIEEEVTDSFWPLWTH